MTLFRCPDPDRLEMDRKFGADPQMCVVRVGGDGGKTVNVEMPCIDVLDGAYCSSYQNSVLDFSCHFSGNEGYTLTPSNVITMRGMVLATVFITLFWLLAELLLRNVDMENRKEKMLGMQRMAKELPAKKE